MTRKTKYGTILTMTLSAGLAVAGPVGTDQAMIPTGQAGWVDARATGDTTPLPRVAEPERPNRRRPHPPIDEIPAMPLSHALEMPPLDANASGGVPVVFDMASREERQLQLPESVSRALGGGNAGFNGADLATSDEDGVARSFGTMTEVNAGSFPWRMNVKLVMRFVDSNGVDRFFVASGSMADAETILTAGHVVYARTPNGITINDWAADIWVYPGWDGVGSADEFSGNFGEADSTSLASWTGWTQNGDFDRDIGIIRVNRAVGMLTGWYGGWWGADCSTVMSRTYNVGSYPAEGCGQTGLHNGRDQYYWWGTYDSCPGQQLQTTTTPGCFTAQWGGMSGGGSYFFADTDVRAVHAVISNSNNSTFARHVKQWESWYNFRTDFINGSRGDSFDLQALQARYSDSTPTAGQTITCEFDAPNPTNANPGSNTYTFRHYLSTNDFISTFDTQLGSEWIYTFNYGAMQNVHINAGSVTIPIGTPSGTYWLGVELDPSTDGVDSNDNTDGWDSFQVNVTGVADIVANTLSAPSGTFNPGESFIVSYNIGNQGGDSSNTVGLDFRASLNTIISTGDVPIGSTSTSGLSGNSSRNGSVVVTLPPNMAPGTYYIGLITSASDDVDGSNNSTFDAIPITVAECVADFAPAYGVLDFDDVLAFLTAFGSGSSEADLAPAFGVLDFDDVLRFLSAYGAGCP